MLKLTIETEDGMRLVLGGTGNPYQLIDVDGMGPCDVSIATTAAAGYDGEMYQAARADMRQLNLAVALNTIDPEYYRQELYRALAVRKEIAVYYTGADRDVVARGYVQQVDVTYTENPQTITIAILCPSPWWASTQELVNTWRTLHENFIFPFSSTASPKELVLGTIEQETIAAVVNGGEVACGLVFKLYARGTVKNPRLINVITREYIALNLTMDAGDEVTIDTRAGAKTATMLRNGVVTSVFNQVDPASTWLQLDRLGCSFELGADFGLSGLEGTIYHNNLYAGV